jgi:hypothetical protein
MKKGLDPEVVELLNDRIVSLQLMADISKLVKRREAAAWYEGFLEGAEAAREYISALVKTVTITPGASEETAPETEGSEDTIPAPDWLDDIPEGPDEFLD